MSNAPLDEPITRDLQRAATYQFLALLFLPPSAGLRDELHILAGALPEQLRAAARALVAEAGPEIEHEYHALLGGSGRCRHCESDYQGIAIGGKGPIIADVAAFYRAFHFSPPALRLAPDHIAVELDFLGYLAMKTAYARHTGLAGEREMCEAASASFVRDHLGQFADSFLAQLAAAAGDRFHGHAARFAARALA
ncbi:MAG TPA: molecular chaperone TorD family protein [Kofleriaceae bacterium]|nr:molecular chaperone TorD family protein [Kofleriaceae bacterium]